MCCSLCSSVVRMKTAEGLGSLASLWMRFAKGVGSDVCPRLMAAMVRWLAKVKAASMGEALNHWRWMGGYAVVAAVVASR